MNSAAVREQALRAGLRGSFEAWAQHVMAGEGRALAPHHRLMAQRLQGVADGEVDRLMVLMPPGHAKSTYASLLFPPWFLQRQPGAPVIACSHTMSLAERFGRGVRGLLRQHGARLGAKLDESDRAAGRFGVDNGGAYFAAGVRGPVTGRRADLLLIDDPVKSRADADSALVRERVWDWYCSDLLTRLRPGGRVVLVMTRWHPDDLGGRLLDGPERWEVLRFPALAEAGDPLGRQPGDALWPEWEDVPALERKRAAMGERAFQALFQQSPRVPGGRLFLPERMPVGDMALPGAAVRAWDLAASSEGDWTAGVKLVCGEHGWQVADVRRLRAGPDAVVALILDTARSDGAGVVVALPQDPGQAGRAQVQFLTRALAGFVVRSSTETGAKATRAMPVASQVNAGCVGLLRGSWNRAFTDELRDFPGGTWDDQADALARAFGVLAGAPAPARAAQVAWGMR